MDTIWIAGRNDYDDFQVFGYFRSLEGARAAVEGRIRDALAEGYLDNTEDALEPLAIENADDASCLWWSGNFFVNRVAVKP